MENWLHFYWLRFNHNNKDKIEKKKKNENKPAGKEFRQWSLESVLNITTADTAIKAPLWKKQDNEWMKYIL